MKKGEFLGFDVLDVSSICIETICRPGTIAKPNILLSPNWGLSTESSDKYSSQVPKMTLASLSVHRKMPMREWTRCLKASANRTIRLESHLL